MRWSQVVTRSFTWAASRWNAPSRKFLEANIKGHLQPVRRCAPARPASVWCSPAPTTSSASTSRPAHRCDGRADGPTATTALSKSFGEDVAQFYFDRYGIETVSIRIGSSFPEPLNRRMMSSWLSYRDLTNLVERSLFTPDVKHTIVYGMSANRDVWWDNAPPRTWASCRRTVRKCSATRSRPSPRSRRTIRTRSTGRRLHRARARSSEPPATPFLFLQAVHRGRGSPVQPKEDRMKIKQARLLGVVATAVLVLTTVAAQARDFRSAKCTPRTSRPTWPSRR